MSTDYESVADDILKPKIKVAKLKALEIWGQYCNKKIPVILNDIITSIGIPVKGLPLSETTYGYTKTDENGAYIIYNTNSPRARQRFTVAHEIGHIVLEHTSIFGGCDQYSQKSQETEANAFAAELLIPSTDLKIFLKTQKSMQEVIDRYQVSKEAAFISVQEHKLLKKIVI